jgi:hypothetical protein
MKTGLPLTESPHSALQSAVFLYSSYSTARTAGANSSNAHEFHQIAWAGNSLSELIGLVP